MSNLNRSTKNPSVLFSKAEISRRLCSHAPGWDSDLPLRFCMGLGEPLHLILSSCFPVWEAETVLIPQQKLNLVMAVKPFEICQRGEKP